MSKVVIDKSMIKASNEMLGLYASIENCKIGATFADDDISIEIDISNSTYDKNSVGALIDPESYKFIELANSIRRFGHDGYQDRSGHKEIYVLKKDLFGYQAGKKFFTRGEMLYPVNVSQDCIGFNKDIAFEIGYVVKPIQTIHADMIDNNVGIVFDPEDNFKVGDYVHVNGTRLMEITSKTWSKGIEEKYFAVSFK